MAIRYLSGINVDSNTLFVDSTNNRVGIGTGSPGFKLTVVGGNGNQLGLDNAGERFTQISFLESGSQNSAIWLDGTDNMFDMYANTGHGIRLKTGGDNPRLIVTSGGNVLIGTTTDAGYKLDVNGTGRFSGSITSNASGVGTLLLGSTSGSSQIAGRITATESPSYNSTGKIGFSVTTWGVGTDYGLTEVMAIDMRGADSKAPTIWMNPFGGNVGIGTTSPVNCALAINQDWVSGSATVKAYPKTTMASGGLAGFGVFDSDGTTRVAYMTGTASSMELWAQSNIPMNFGTNDTQRMRITAGGNVLIGTTTDSGEKLVVNGTIGVPFSSTIRVAGGGFTRNDIITTGYNNISDLKDFLILEAPGSSNGKIILGTGSYVSVGIGTNAPASGLVVSVSGSKWDSDSQYNQPAGNIFSNLGFCVADQENWIGMRGAYNSSSGSANLLLQANFRDVGSNAGHYVASQAISLGNADFVIGRLQTQTSVSTAPAKVEQFRLYLSGQLKLNLYGSGTFTGTPAYNLGVDSSGNVIELPGGVVDGSGTANYVTKWQDANTVTNSIIRDDGTTVGIGQAPAAAKLSVETITTAGETSYGKSYASLDTTGVAVAGLNASTNGQSALFTFTCYGGESGFQRIVYSCYNDSSNWLTSKVIDEGTNTFDVTASANGSTITFTYKARTANQGYSPRILIQHLGSAINTSYL